MKNGFLQVLLTVAALIGPQIAVAQTAPAGDGENGKRLYLRDGCFQCHGYAGQGGRAGARGDGGEGGTVIAGIQG